jgi:DNA-binding MarR family transcriptional regulator
MVAHLSAQASILTSMVERLSDRELGAWRGFLRAHARLWRDLEGSLASSHGLSLSAYDVLVLLDETPGGTLRMSELAAAVLMTSGGFTRLADRLERAGLIRRERCATDARGFDVSLTERGRSLLNDARATHRADVRERFLERLTPEEQETLATIWARLLEPAVDPAGSRSS